MPTCTVVCIGWNRVVRAWRAYTFKEHHSNEWTLGLSTSFMGKSCVRYWPVDTRHTRAISCRVHRSSPTRSIISTTHTDVVPCFGAVWRQVLLRVGVQLNTIIFRSWPQNSQGTDRITDRGVCSAKWIQKLVRSNGRYSNATGHEINVTDSEPRHHNFVNHSWLTTSNNATTTTTTTLSFVNLTAANKLMSSPQLCQSQMTAIKQMTSVTTTLPITVGIVRTRPHNYFIKNVEVHYPTVETTRSPPSQVPLFPRVFLCRTCSTNIQNFQ